MAEQESKPTIKQCKQKIQFEDTQQLKMIESFEDLNLKQNIFKAIHAYGLEKPSIVHQRVIFPMINKQNILAEIESSESLITAFTIALLQIIDCKNPNCQAIILTPFRESVQNINKIVSFFSSFLQIKSHCCMGGQELKKDIKTLKQEEIQIVIGTPGRVQDLINKKVINTDFVRLVLLDKLEDILSRGFQDILLKIFQYLPPDVQFCMFTDSMGPELIEITNKIINNSVKITIKKESLTLEGQKQFYILVQKGQQMFDLFLQVYKSLQIGQCLIFINQKEQMMKLAQLLPLHNYAVQYLSSEMTIKKRQEIMRDFRIQKVPCILLSTDFEKSSIDKHMFQVIINYGLHISPQKYIARVGRSGCFGYKGIIINFATVEELQHIKYFQKYFNTFINELPGDLSQIFY